MLVLDLTLVQQWLQELPLKTFLVIAFVPGRTETLRDGCNSYGLSQKGTRMRYTEARPQSQIKAKTLFWGGADRTIDPGVSVDVTILLRTQTTRCFRFAP